MTALSHKIIPISLQCESIGTQNPKHKKPDNISRISEVSSHINKCHMSVILLSQIKISYGCVLKKRKKEQYKKDVNMKYNICRPYYQHNII